MKIGSKEYKNMAARLHRQVDEDSSIKYLTDAHYVDEFRVHIKFNNGEEGIVDLKDKAKRQGVFELLNDVKYFRKVKYSSELGTICWPNGADLAPEYLYEKLNRV